MKLTGPACTEALSEAEEAERRERAEDSASGVRVERRVRQLVISIGTLALPLFAQRPMRLEKLEYRDRKEHDSLFP
jgi:hypothetical protein